MNHPKQARYKNEGEDKDFLDEFFRDSTSEEIRGAMKFTMGKYVKRLGKKDDLISELKKINDYSARYTEHLELVAPKEPM